MTLEKNAIVLTLEWYIPDNWYGTRRRVVLSLDGSTGFKNVSEANSHRSLFVKYINATYSKPREGGKVEKFKGSETKAGALDSFPTYIYCGAGPSYSCTNISITVDTLQEWFRKWEKSDEAREKARASEYRKAMAREKARVSEYRKAMADVRKTVF